MKQPIETAPKDGTLIFLWVQSNPAEHGEDSNPTEDVGADELWRTIGFNQLDHTGDDDWFFAGWCWSHDHYTEGKGLPKFWAPIPE